MGLINERLLGFVQANARKLDDALDNKHDVLFDYFGLRTLYDRYLLRHPSARTVIETPQQFFLQIACALSEDVAEALAFYQRMARLDYLPSSPTLFNAGTTHEQLSSCFLLDSPDDSLSSIYQRYGDVAQLSKFSGVIVLSFSRIRSRGSLIRSTNGLSNGLVPWLKTLDASVAAVNQGGKRKGAACVYLETWHADIGEFLELLDSTGDEGRRTHNLNLANWVSDLFMRRVEADAWNIVPENTARWDSLRERIREQGLCNYVLIAIAPTATIASIAGCYECIEPRISNLFKRETLSGDFLQVNRYLVEQLKKLGLWTPEVRDRTKLSEGSIQSMAEIPKELRKMYRTVWEVPMRSLIDKAAYHGAFIDQSQSLNLFMESPNIGALSSMYMYVWKRGIKTTYYLRSRPATRIAKTTVTSSEQDTAAVSCSLENPESCEACQ